MYFDDHAPPHFHVITNDGREVLVDFDGTILAGAIFVREIAEALDWVSTNRALIMDRWKEFN